MANKVIRIKATGKLAWAICGTSLAGAIVLYIATPYITAGGAAVTAPVGGVGGVVGGSISFTGGVALTTVPIATIGIAPTIVAIGVGVAAGGYGGILALRNKYKISEKGYKRLVLTKK